MHRLFAIALILTAVPGALAQQSMDMEAEMRMSADFRTMTLEADVDMNGEEAEEFRSNFDTDEDGEVTQAEFDEVMEFMADMMEGMQQGLAEEMGTEGITLDGKAATGFEVGDFEFTGIVGDVDQSGPVTMSMEMEVTFPASSGDRHVLVMSGDDEPSDEEDTEGMSGEIRIVAPAGWQITEHTKVDGLSLSGDKRTLSGDFEDVMADEQADEDMRIVFAKGGSGGKDSPGAGPLMALGVLAVALVVRRRI